MANKTIAQLDTISGSIDNATDLAILYDSSATKTVKTTIQNLLTSQLSGLETSGSNVVSAINELHSKLTETISEIASTETSPASANHQPGELILYDGGLYRTTSYIVIGESLTQIGDSANIESITISDCIKELYGVQSFLGNETMGTTATTVTGAIAEVNNNIGSEEMGTTATTVTGAIAEHEGDIVSINSNLSRSTTIKKGTYTITNAVCFGFLSSGGTMVLLDLPLNISSEVNQITLTSLTLAIRTPSGTYVGGSSSFNGLPYLSGVSIFNMQPLLGIDLTKSDGWGITNNVPVCGQVSFSFTAS